MHNTLPRFSKINAQHIEAELDKHLQNNRDEIAELLTKADFNWDNLIVPLEEIDDRLNQFWSPISHLNSVMNSAELRQAYNACLAKLSDYGTEIGQNHDLFMAYQFINDHHYATLDSAQKKVIDNALRDFKLSGVALEGGDKKRYQELQQQLSQLTTKFEENVLDTTNKWQYLVNDKAQLEGIPEHAIAMAKQQAEQNNLEGWLLTLDIPCYIAVMTHADSGELRELFYRAYVTRASELSEYTELDNSEVIQQILTARLALAKLLGFDSYAHYSLVTKMAQKPTEVLDFLNHLAEQAKPKALKELAELQEFAQKVFGVETLNVWDVGYYSEKLKHQRYHISQETLRPYFPEHKVLAGMFSIINKLYGMSVIELTDVDTWHPDVKFYQITDEQKNIRGYVYMDLYARKNKRGGAWMDECVVRRRLADSVQLPVAFLTCNFSAPVGNQPALLTHDEAVTLFHEFGHTLHHLLTQVNYSDVSGINGVAWDAVELPSQFFENWCWDRESIALISSHYQTGESLPDDILQQMLAAKNFHSALHIVRQVEFSLFDFHLHLEFNPQKAHQVQTVLNNIRQQVAAIEAPAFNRFQHSFSHIFAGGYSAGYYSYLWAEVLACDAFGLFLEKGIFDHDSGRRFLHNILEQGGSCEPMELFIRFRGREPLVEALLVQTGIH